MRFLPFQNSFVKPSLFSYDDKYILTASYHQGNSSGSASVSKSIASYVTEDGEILLPVLQKEVDALYKKLTKKE